MAELRELRKAAIYCRNAETYGSFEPKDEHNKMTEEQQDRIIEIIHRCFR